MWMTRSRINMRQYQDSEADMHDINARKLNKVEPP